MPPGIHLEVTTAATLLLFLAVHLVLTALPGIAFVLFAVRRGVRALSVLLALGLAGSGAIAMLSFWAYYASPRIGETWAFFVLFGASALCAWCLRGRRLDRGLLRRLATPLALWALGSAFVVFLGFLHGGTDQAISLSSSRFTWALPSDNDIPRFFAEWFAGNGHSGVPPVYPGEWLMSDRPPLQIGYVLSQRAFTADTSNLHYEILGVVIQQLWIVGMWAVLCGARLRPTTRGLAMFAAMVSDIAIVHGFFVWPKLLATAFLLAGVALVVSPRWIQLRTDPRAAALLASLLALSLLAHGSSIFGVIPLAVVAGIRGLPSWRFLAVGAMVGIALLAPWVAYQHFADPPGNRLLKWQLAGFTQIDDRGTVETVADAYREAGFVGTLGNKWANFSEMIGLHRVGTEVGEAIDYVEAGHPVSALAKLRGPRFYSLLPFLGVFLIAPFAMFIARRRGRKEEGDWGFATLCFALVGIACLAWGLLVFGDGGALTTLHIFSLAVPLLALCGCVAGLSATYPRLAVALVALNCIAVLAMYTPAVTPPPGTSYSPIAGLLATVSLLGFGWVAFRGPTSPDP